MSDAVLIYELDPAEFGRARELFTGARYDAAFLGAVFEGRQAGRLFVDDPVRPRAALLCRTYEFFVAGDAGGIPVRRFIADAPAEAAVFDTFYGYVGLSPAWDGALLADHGGRLEVIDRRGFRFPGSEAGRVRGWRESVPAGIEVEALDMSLAKRVDDVLGEGIGATWGGYERFGESGFGFCATIDGLPVSVAVSAAVGWGEANIGVITAATHRRQGLARIVCAAYVAACLDRGLAATWDCDLMNVASRALALNLGFGEERSFTELASPGRAPLALSRGRWRRVAPGEGGLLAWRHEILPRNGGYANITIL